MKLPSNAHIELHTGSLTSQQNWLRAGVLGANDGIVSVAALIVGVAGATADIKLILITGVAGMTAGALSMAAGEYVSVSSQRDTERALLEKERRELAESPAEELEELTVIYEKKGLARPTAETVARELTAHDAFTAHVEAELGIHAHDLTNPWHAAIASGFSFVVGAFIPLAAIIISPPALHIPATFIGVIIALAITGYLSARVSDAPPTKVVTRVVIGGAIAMAITYGIGTAFGIATA